MTENGFAYRSHAWRQRCTAHDLHHLRTRPYTPRTNGKAKRFTQILLRSWAYAFAYSSSAHRTRALGSWLRWYNRRRCHGSLDGQPPVSRVSHLCVVSTPRRLSSLRPAGSKLPAQLGLLSNDRPASYAAIFQSQPFW